MVPPEKKNVEQSVRALYVGIAEILDYEKQTPYEFQLKIRTTSKTTAIKTHFTDIL